MLEIDLKTANEGTASMYGRIAEALCAAITSGKLSPGDRLPSEVELAEQLSVNRLTACHAYDHLRGLGLIVRKRGSGTYVAADALRRLESKGKRRIANVAFVIGEESLSACARENLFILADLLDGMEDVLGRRETNFKCVRALTPECERDLLEADAVVLESPRARDARMLGELARRGVPVLSIWHDRTAATVPYVDYDRYESGAMACRHLLRCGYRRLGFLGTMASPWMSLPLRFTAFSGVLHEHQLPVKPEHVRHVTVAPGRAYAAMQAIIKSGDIPEAFFVDTDYKAMEAIHALQDHGLRVPEDVGVVAYDDIPEAASFKPPLTTVRVPRREIGRRAAQLLLNWPADGCQPENIVLSSELVVRGSCHTVAAPLK